MKLPEPVLLEQALMGNWPALETLREGAWVWRFSRGYTRRSNSLMFLDPDEGGEFASRLSVHTARFVEYGIVPCVRVTPLTPVGVRDLLKAQGWRLQGDTRVLVKKPEVNSVDVRGIEIDELAPDSKAWIDVVAGLGVVPFEHVQTYRAMMGMLPEGAAGFVMREGAGRAVCCALASISHGVGGVVGLQTAPSMQRRGLGRALMQHVMNRMLDRGAHAVALQVVAGNEAAFALYESLGFSQAYAYHYRVLLKGKK